MNKFLVLLFIIFLTVAASAQTAKLEIVPEKKVYKRTGKDIPDFRQTFEVRKPVIKTKLNADVRSHIEDAIDYWRVFEMSLADNLVDDTWLDNFDYDIKYNDKYFLSIALNSEGSAAYPSSWTKWVNVDTHTGEILLIDDLFAEDKQPELMKLINAKMIENEKAAIAENPDVKEALDDQRGSYGDEIQPKAGKLELSNIRGFYVTPESVVFVYEYGFPHVILALEPSGEYSFTYKEIKPFVRPGSLLENIVR